MPNMLPSRLARCVLQCFVALFCMLPLHANAQEVVLDLWHAYRDNERAALESVVNDFQAKNPNIKVKVLAVPDESFDNKVFTAVPRGSGPDVFIRAHDPIGNWADNKIVADLSKDLSAAELQQYHPVTVEAVKYNGGMYAIPLAYKSVALFYNKDLVPNPPKTSGELLEYMKANTDEAQQKYALVYENTNLFFHSAWLNGYNGTLFDAEGNIRVNTQEIANSFDYAKKLSQYMPTGVDGARIKSLFNDGNAAMVINGPWFMAELKKELNYGIAVLPTIDETGRPAGPYVTAEGIYLAHDTEDEIQAAATDPAAAATLKARRDASISLMKYIASEGAYKRIVEGKQLVAYMAAYDQLQQDTRPEAEFMKVIAPTFLAQLNNGVPSSNRPEMGSLWSSMQQALQKSLYGGPSGETPYLLFLFLSLIVCGFIFLAKATNPSVVSRERHLTHIGVCIASFIAAIPVFIWMASIQGANSLVEPLTALNEAQSRIAMLKPPPVTDGNPLTLIAIVCGLLAVACVFGIKAWNKHKAKNIEYTDNKIAALFVTPAVIGMIVLVFLPFIVGAFLSFFSYQNGGFIFVGMDNFVRLFSADQASPLDSMSIYFTFVVTVLWTITNVALHVGIGMALALLLREPWLKLKGIYRVLLIVPWAMPNYITALIWRGMFDHNFGAINNLLTTLGLQRVEWFNEFLTSFAANLTTNTWLGFPFMMVVTLGALQAIPRDLEDAAAVDGASAWQRFRNVTFPLLKPALMPSVVLGSIWTFNAFNIIYLVSKGSPDGSTEILVTEAYKWAFERQYQYGYAAAYAMLVFVILVLYSKLTQFVLADDTAKVKKS